MICPCLQGFLDLQYQLLNTQQVIQKRERTCDHPCITNTAYLQHYLNDNNITTDYECVVPVGDFSISYLEIKDECTYSWVFQ